MFILNTSACDEIELLNRVTDEQSEWDFKSLVADRVKNHTAEQNCPVTFIYFNCNI